MIIKFDNAYTHIRLGAVYHVQGKLEEAILEYKLAIQSNPDFAYAHIGLGIAHKEQKKRINEQEEERQ